MLSRKAALRRRRSAARGDPGRVRKPSHSASSGPSILAGGGDGGERGGGPGFGHMRDKCTPASRAAAAPAAAGRAAHEPGAKVSSRCCGSGVGCGGLDRRGAGRAGADAEVEVLAERARAASRRPRSRAAGAARRGRVGAKARWSAARRSGPQARGGGRARPRGNRAETRRAPPRARGGRWNARARPPVAIVGGSERWSRAGDRGRLEGAGTCWSGGQTGPLVSTRGARARPGGAGAGARARLRGGPNGAPRAGGAAAGGLNPSMSCRDPRRARARADRRVPLGALLARFEAGLGDVRRASVPRRRVNARSVVARIVARDGQFQNRAKGSTLTPPPSLVVPYAPKETPGVRACRQM